MITLNDFVNMLMNKDLTTVNVFVTEEDREAYRFAPEYSEDCLLVSYSTCYLSSKVLAKGIADAPVIYFYTDCGELDVIIDLEV